jgi:hypothetical protein
MPMVTARSPHAAKNMQHHDIINIFIFHKTQRSFRKTPQTQHQAADSSTNAADDLFYSQQRSPNTGQSILPGSQGLTEAKAAQPLIGLGGCLRYIAGFGHS